MGGGGWSYVFCFSPCLYRILTAKVTVQYLVFGSSERQEPSPLLATADRSTDRQDRQTDAQHWPTDIYYFDMQTLKQA